MEKAATLAEIIAARIAQPSSSSGSGGTLKKKQQAAAADADDDEAEDDTIEIPKLASDTKIWQWIAEQLEVDKSAIGTGSVTAKAKAVADATNGKAIKEFMSNIGATDGGNHGKQHQIKATFEHIKAAQE